MSFAKSPDSYSALPLGSIPAYAFDTETTGLDVTRDRVIEVGAIRLQSGGMADDDTFAALVNPGIPIPETTSKIHGIKDADVVNARGFSDVIGEFARWAGPAVMLGYSLGFDLAVLKSEHERCGLPWQPPRSLCVRQLAAILQPRLPDNSLEIIAGWLDIEVVGRHRALGDAKLTAEVFLALVPRLRAIGITTLAAAERACRLRAERSELEAKAGWHEVVRRRDLGRAQVAEYARIDSFPYRYRVAELMSAPPLVIEAARPLSDALKLMVERGIGSLFLQRNGDATEHGIATERDILRALHKEGTGVLRKPIGQCARWPVVTVEGREFVYRAMATMTAKGIRHLGVTGPAGELIGALSMRDLMRHRTDAAIFIGDRIETARSACDLGKVWSELTSVVRALAVEAVDPRDIAAVISRELRGLTRRACELAQEELAERGLGRAPAPFALLVLGSGGRGESLLAMDQDNAIVYGRGAADSWFEAVGTPLSDILNEAGLVYCSCGVMASNPEWRMDIEQWRETVQSWINRSNPQDLLYCDIFFDAMAVHGDTELAETLRANAIELARESRLFLHLLGVNAADFRKVRGIFGGLKLEDGRVDLKMAGLMPIFSAARVAALRNGLPERSTRERLEALKSLDTVAPETIGNLLEAHRVLLGLVLGQQLRDIDEGLPLSNRVAPRELDDFDRQQLHWALEQVPSVRDLLGTPAFG